MNAVTKVAVAAKVIKTMTLDEGRMKERKIMGL